MVKEHQEYIANMLRHASYKKYENYVLSQIYWKLIAKGIELKLVTQQTVFRNDDCSHVAYMDGYFPALNIQIEVDEPHHKLQQKADSKREDDIMLVLGAIQLDAEPTVLRVDTTKDIDKQVDECVEFIEKRYHDFNEPQWKDISNVDVVKKQGFIRYSDNMIFKLKNGLVNSIGLKTKSGLLYSKQGTQSISLVHKDNGDSIWFPCISDNMATGWLNNYDAHTHTFTTQHVGNFKKNYNWVNSEKLFNAGTYKDRYIIFKVIDSFNNRGYKYYGKYKCIACDAKTQTEVWKRTSIEDLAVQ